ncbi:aminotransferase class I/II-fold pyridoxal phosphate-dependent enzyme [Streptomyces sp. N2-109]|uniref:Aminotransferase class I/II-fold pyridoxal phosphate-dependent enzyme n=1 Tax=Streptomyces gossypii TaxID=2883101 RepID=A0ABT2JVP8_9ACTN|nr:aminotransferase class I/II-fold pyridoxal phosphate-dependent enzyme [Streptomyces gossypii]MCT2591529.1 aminotransferase class I/II-fold pyridoxal phosphate-dependent enzyme [Streptomyces gossypii]
MRRSTDIDALQHVLCAALGSPAPVCSPAQLETAAEEFAALEPAALKRPTLMGGALYSPTSPAPTGRTLGALLRRAEELDVRQVLVPHVRRSDDTRALRAAGFVPFAADTECVLRLTGDVDDLLRNRMGTEELDDLRRRHHAAAQEVTWERVRLSELDGADGADGARDAFVELHQRQAESGGGRRNPYTAEALDALAQGALGERTEILVRRRKDSVVQAGLVTTSHNGRGLYSLTQAMDPDDPVMDNGLCAVTLYGLCLDAQRSGLDWLHLGRGDVHRKRILGADLFVPLDHWLRAEDLTPPKEGEEEPELSRFAAPPVTTVPVPGPARFRRRPRFDTIDLSGNTNPLLGAEAQYPHLDTTELARTYLTTLSKVPGHDGTGALSTEHLLFTSGAVDGVMLLLAALTSPGERVCVTPPTFELYAHFARLLRLPVVDVPLRGDDLFELDTERILAADPRVTFLCDPNNPVGTRLDPAQVHALVARCRGLVVIDEAYVEFSENPSYAELVGQHDNLIVLRTLSKAWGLAGARCGAVLAQPGIIDALRRAQVPFGFTDASQRAVRDRLTNSQRALASIPLIRAERERMAAALAAHPAVERVFPSETNFLLVRLHEHEHVMEQLRSAGIIVADTGHLVRGTCRITVGDRHADDTLLEALSAAL